LFSLLTPELFPLADAQPFDGYVHNPRPVQRGHSIAKRVTHAPDLPVPSLGQDDAKLIAPDARHLTGPRDASENDDSAGHAIQECLVERTIDLHEILPFMSEFGAENLVHDVPIVRQQDETRRIFIQPSDGENPFWVPDLRNDIAGDM
jgi:hypothetical protein